MKKRIISILLIGLLLTCLSACTEKWEQYIGKWELESYETSEGIFTSGDSDWSVEGMIIFFNKGYIEIDVDATRNSGDKNIRYFNDYVSIAADWSVIESGDIEVTFDGHVVTAMHYENDRLILNTKDGTFTLKKISDNPEV